MARTNVRPVGTRKKAAKDARLPPDDATPAAKRALPTHAFEDARAWAAWLAAHHTTAPGLWMRIAKKGSGVASVTYSEALDVALAHGWIDGQKRALAPGDGGGTAWLQKWTPRARKSLWSKVNRDRALALVARGEMQPAGLAEVERARGDGRWDAAYDGQRRAEVPPDLAAALAASPRAAKVFATLDARNRYAVLFRVHTAKKAETRAARIARFVAMLARGELLHP
jgi:uncharacterized protein YdeI (YjbR/CyaY-like superfamily)